MKNWKVIFTIWGYLSLIMLSIVLFGPLNIIGGLLIVIITDACLSSFLFMVDNLVRQSKVTLEDFKKGFTVYFWDIVSLGFAIGIPFWIASEILLKYPQGFIFIIFFRILTYLFFNAVPELIYTGSHNTLEIFRRSYLFIVENWIEWFIPNLLAVIPFYLIWLISIPVLDIILKPLLVSFLVYFVMIFRGFLFLELSGSTPQQRSSRYRIG